MDLSVQYATTPDGMSIAYTVSGEGHPLVFVPLGLNHVQLSWRYDHRISGWLEALNQRFRLIRYDSRGQGMSTRGLPPEHSMDRYLVDLETVVDRLGLERFVLLGYFFQGHTAIRYAAAHPERVEALVLVSCSTSMASWPMSAPLGLAQQAWEIFLRSWVPEGSTREETEQYVSYFRQTATVTDYELCARAFASSDVTEVLPRLKMPALVIHPRDFLWLPAAEVTRLAALIPNARVVLTDGSMAFGDVTQGMQAIDSFFAGLPAPKAVQHDKAVAHDLDGLSPREVEVLRLITRGYSNQQIAGELVLSVRTVERHINHIYAKIDAHSKAQATAYALRHNVM
jgi:pimeloyl-ACP methyl ester carboxylesterase/DNA-binding CsgD family transcriptional regulator